MAKLQQAFDSNNYEDMSTFDPLPVGPYNAQITKSDLCITKNKKGKYIKLEFTVIDGDFKGKKAWTNLNIINANPVAVEIANKTLATICRVCNKPVVQDTVELHGIPMVINLRIKKQEGTDYPPQNNITGFSPLGGTPKTAPGKKPPVKRPAAKKAAAEDVEVEVDGDGPGWGEEE